MAAATTVSIRGKSVIIFYDGVHDLTNDLVSDDIPLTGLEMRMSFKATRKLVVTETTAKLQVQGEFGEGATSRMDELFLIAPGAAGPATDQAALLGNASPTMALVMHSTSGYHYGGGMHKTVRLFYTAGDASQGEWWEFSFTFDYETIEHAQSAYHDLFLALTP